MSDMPRRSRRGKRNDRLPTRVLLRLYIQVLIKDVSCLCENVLVSFRWLSEHRSCPCCRSPITSEDLRPIHRIWREKLVGLRLKCSNIVHGCTAEVTLEELPDHLSICQYAHVPCPHTPCSEVMLKSMLGGHVNVCQYRKILCDECGLQFRATERDKHKCMTSLREHLKEKIEAAKREVIGDCMKVVRRERRHYENLLHEQKRIIEELRRSLNNLASNSQATNKMTTLQLGGNSASCSRDHSSNPTRPRHPAREPNRLSLPRLAPLHTHMNLLRGKYSMYWCALN